MAVEARIVEVATCRTLLLLRASGSDGVMTMSPWAPLFLFVFSLTQTTALDYPETRKDDSVVDTYFGTDVPDPFRWLEDDQSDETAAWVKAQNKVTREFLDAVPGREHIHARLSALWDYERVTSPFREGGKYFWRRNDGLQNQSVLFVGDAPYAEDARVLLDPNTLSEDGTVSLAGYEVSRDGKHLAYGLSSAGSDWKEWRVRDIATGEDLPDHVQWVKFSGVDWMPDGTGFYYSRYDEPGKGEELTAQNFFQKVYFHRLGDDQSDDQLVYERPDQKEWGFGAHVTDDSRFLLLHVWQGTDPKNALFYQRMDKDGAQETVELLPDFDASYSFIDCVGDVFYLKTDLDAPRGRVIAIDVTKPDRGSWKEVIAESEDTLESVNLLNGQLVCAYLHDATSRVRIHGLDGELVRDVDLPGLGSVYGFGGRAADSETFFTFTGFTDPGTIYRHDMATGKSEILRTPQIDFDGSPYETTQVFVESKDGTRVPLFLVHKKGIELDGSHPTVLYGYGGFNVSLGPGFSIPRSAWLERGGVYAMAILRGGGEYGEDWHQAGTKLNKQNVFDDFIACAEWLIDKDYTSTPNLAIEGGSNGGLLVGACMTQRPELFGAALPHVGVMDMLRYHKFTIGWAWASDYGTAEDSKEMFDYLHRYSPLHALRDGTSYPPTMVFTGDHDDRVVPAHSFKFAARLQDAHAGEAPVLIRIETSAGHGAGTPTSKSINEAADRMVFLEAVLGRQ